MRPTAMTKTLRLLSAAVLLRLTPALAQTGVIAPNENLVADGVPPLHHERNDAHNPLWE